jgi:hypothetical protein
MPLTWKGRKMKESMDEEYGKEKGDQVFYATENKRKGRGLRLGKKLLWPRRNQLRLCRRHRPLPRQLPALLTIVLPATKAAPSVSAR